ncbi:hypothetical protein [Bradyrhizobium sp. CCBAU 65884]|uniref:hypothetical protein n=1 Tax=Bradyrhizobium sp. CCBAU 65884 TaxID=722477 RepID=UPI0023050493|nr:hypothetical protein [Bradyrhizobium sp. CCBAU 65884]
MGDIQAIARQEADEAPRLRVLEKDQTIESMAQTIWEVMRKAEHARSNPRAKCASVKRRFAAVSYGHG